VLGVVVKQGGFGSLTTAQQGGVGRKLAEEVGFAGAAWPQLDEVKVGLHQSGQPGDEMHLNTLAEFGRFQPHRAQNYIKPGIPAKFFAPLN
jgi:hypothetical protein